MGLITEQPRNRTGKQLVGFVEIDIPIGDGGDCADSCLVAGIEHCIDVGFARQRQVKHAARSGPHTLAVVRIHAVTGENDAVGPDSIRDPYDGPGITGVGNTDRGREQQRSVATRTLCLGPIRAVLHTVPGPLWPTGRCWREHILERHIDEIADSDQSRRCDGIPECASGSIGHECGRHPGPGDCGNELAGPNSTVRGVEQLPDAARVEGSSDRVGSFGKKEPALTARGAAMQLHSRNDPRITTLHQFSTHSYLPMIDLDETARGTAR